ncbi:hypothetical protein BJ741DRAFT_590455 [Chytriomyces cf. hyalinus JEL632]|nr:hypothetical protein BJ741DRAFT_590455 [Chytriomyces cf. hyalinus JEL632]
MLRNQTSGSSHLFEQERPTMSEFDEYDGSNEQLDLRIDMDEFEFQSSNSSAELGLAGGGESQHEDASLDLRLIDECLRDSEHLLDELSDVSDESAAAGFKSDQDAQASRTYNQASETLELSADELSQLDQLGVDAHSLSHESSPLEQLLKDTLTEIQSIKELNSQLVLENEKFRNETDALSLHLEKLNEHFEAYKDQSEKETTEQIDSLINQHQQQIRLLESEISQLRSSQTQMSDIRKSLQEEKDMDVLTLRVELMSQKEQQLQTLKEEMDRERQENTSALVTEMDTLKRGFELERIALCQEVDQLHETIELLEQSQREKHCIASVHTSTQTSSANNTSDASTQSLLSKIDCESQMAVLNTLCAMFNLPNDKFIEIQSSITTYVTDVDNKLASFVRHCSNRDKELADAKREIAILNERNKNWEHTHTSTLQTLQQAHENAIESLKLSCDHQLSLLQARLASWIDPDGLTSQQDLEESFPHLLSEVRKDIVSRVRAEQNEAFKTVLEQERLKVENQFHQLIADERQVLYEQYEQDVQAATLEVKHQCSAAYQEAVKKLKNEYLKLERKCIDRYKHAENTVATEGDVYTIVRNQEAYIASLERDHQTHIQLLKANYEDSISRVREEARSQYSAQLRHALEKMKERYIQSIRAQK